MPLATLSSTVESAAFPEPPHHYASESEIRSITFVTLREFELPLKGNMLLTALGVEAPEMTERSGHVCPCTTLQC